MKLCKHQSRRNGHTYCNSYKDFPKNGKCSLRCNRRIPTFWWKVTKKIKTIFENKG